ncbi:MAG: RNA-directed DNA polymerase [Acidobacteriota bacterium]
MRRTRVELDEVASLDRLGQATWRAARGKRHRPEVAAFLVDVERTLARLSWELRTGTVRLGRLHSFRIFDPKPRLIHAPCFEERVVHHALIAGIGPPLDRSLVADTFACRQGKGGLVAVKRAQQHLGRWPWLVQVDVRSYFESLEHDVLKRLLHRRLKGRDVLELCERIIDSHVATPGRGLPIGALTSQHFANLYLSPFDRLLSDDLRVTGQVRYMDDVVWWCRTKEDAVTTLADAERFLSSALKLTLKWGRVRRSEQGLSFLGFRVLAGTLRLSRRRRARYARARHLAERAFARGEIDARRLQILGTAALAITAHAEAAAWRRGELASRPAVDA